MITIDPIKPEEWKEAFAIMRPVFARGDTCTYAPDITEAEAFSAWIKQAEATFIAKNDNGDVVGIYYLKPNQPGLGSHVVNAGYIVRESARGRGIAALMCEHSQAEAKRRGYRAMQFNTVVSTNEVAVKLWQRLGFEIIGRVPEGFRHKDLGYIDTLIMWKKLSP